MCLHLSFLKHTMAISGIAFNNCGVHCFCISPFKTFDGVLRNCVWQRWRAMFLHLSFCRPTCFFELSMWSVKECYTLWPESMSTCWKKPLPAFSNVPLNATPFKGDLLGSYGSPTISTISGRGAIKQPWEKNVKCIGKVQWLFVVMFSTFFLPNQMDQHRQCKSVHEV